MLCLLVTVCLRYIPRKEIALPNTWKLLFFKKYTIVFIYFWLCWVFAAVWTFSSCSEQGLLSSCSGFSLRSKGSAGHGGVRLYSTGSAVTAHGLHYSQTCGIFPDQGSNPCLLPWQVDSSPLTHQGSPIKNLVLYLFMFSCWMHPLDLV